MGELINSYSILVGKREGKKPLWKRGRISEDNIKMNLKETGFENINRSHHTP
jgi:hypothetical protein